MRRLQLSVEDMFDSVSELESEDAESHIGMVDSDLESESEGSSVTESESGDSSTTEVNSDESEDESDDDDNEEQYLGDTDKAIDNIVKNRKGRMAKPTATTRRESPKPNAKWTTAMQLTISRNTASRIADEYLEKKGIMLETRRRGAKPKEPKAFKDGKMDAKKIDVLRKASKDERQKHQGGRRRLR